jgi:nicotinate-nucleotide pyrophosphorylase (carboxylating)
MELIYPGLNEFLHMALDEDIGTGDVTTNCCVPENAISTGVFTAKESGVISGLGVATRVFELLDDTVRVTPFVKDGDTVKTGEAIAEISGPSRAILTGERLALNLLQHMSAIATRTAEAVREVSNTSTKIKDTRKTTPCLRVLEKYAVICGGGTNHRFNLADGVLIKDNHIKAAGSIANAVKQVLNTRVIEVETESLEQVEEALDAGADIIMLDNMCPEMMSEAVKIINGRALTEASGNMGERNLKTIAETGVDFISIGALTHSVKAMDISLKFK